MAAKNLSLCQLQNQVTVVQEVRDPRVGGRGIMLNHGSHFGIARQRASNFVQCHCRDKTHVTQQGLPVDTGLCEHCGAV